MEFDLVDGLCESVDYSALDAVYLFFPAEVEGRRSTGPPDQAICTLDRSAPSSVTAGGPLGLLVVNVAVYDTSEAARVAYDDLRTARAGFRDHPEAHTRGWDDAAVLRERTNYGSEVEVMTRDGALFLNLRLATSSWSEPPGLDAQQAAAAPRAPAWRAPSAVGDQEPGCEPASGAGGRCGPRRPCPTCPTCRHHEIVVSGHASRDANRRSASMGTPGSARRTCIGQQPPSLTPGGSTTLRPDPQPLRERQAGRAVGTFASGDGRPTRRR